MKALTLTTLLATGFGLTGCIIIKDNPFDTGSGDDGTVTDDTGTTDTSTDITDTSTDSGDTGETEDTAVEPIAAVIDVDCAADPCIVLALSAAESQGDITSYSWDINGEVREGKELVQLDTELVVDALNTVTLTVSGAGGSDSSTLYGLATDSAFNAAEQLEEKIYRTVVTGPLGVCGSTTPNRVLSIGGCVTSSLELIFQDANQPVGPGNAVHYSISSNSLTSLGFGAAAAWRQNPGTEMFDSTATENDYGFGPAYTYKKAVGSAGGDHFTFYFYGGTKSVNTLQYLHKETTPTGSAWQAADKALSFSCEGSGEPTVSITGVGLGSVTFPP